MQTAKQKITSSKTNRTPPNPPPPALAEKKPSASHEIFKAEKLTSDLIRLILGAETFMTEKIKVRQSVGSSREHSFCLSG